MVKIAVPQMGFQLFDIYMKHKYVQSLRCAHAKAVWLPLRDEARALSIALRCDGLLLPGGADIAPGLYGQPVEPGCCAPNPLRDQLEPKLFDAFLQTGKPILGICRGAQMINVCLGGTLYQDIAPLQVCKHSDYPNRAASTHSVALLPGSKLALIYGSQTLAVNSMHHQAVRELGKGLIVSAVSDDGYTEGIELAGHPFCVAVQWHPEHMTARRKPQRKLFQAFADACKGK